MKKLPLSELSMRERQIMELIYEKGEISAAELEKLLPDSLSNSTIRTQLRVLERKGHIKHKEKGLKFVYYPVHKIENVKNLALEHLIKTFFNGSPSNVVAAILSSGETKLTPEELERVSRLIKNAQQEKS